MDSSFKEEHSEGDLGDEYNWSSRYINFDEIQSIDNRVSPEGSTTNIPLDKINEPEYSFAELKSIQTSNERVHIPHKLIGSGLAYAIPHKAVYNKDNQDSECVSVKNLNTRNEIELQFEETSSTPFEPSSSAETQDVKNGRNKKSGSSCRSTFMIMAIFILVVMVICLSMIVKLLVLKPELLIRMSDQTIAPTKIAQIDTTVPAVKPANLNVECPTNEQNPKNVFTINGVLFMVNLQASQGQVKRNMMCFRHKREPLDFNDSFIF